MEIDKINDIQNALNYYIKLGEKNKNIDIIDFIDTFHIINSNKELLELFDKYDRGLLKNEDLTFDLSQYLTNDLNI